VPAIPPQRRRELQEKKFELLLKCRSDERDAGRIYCVNELLRNQPIPSAFSAVYVREVVKHEEHGGCTVADNRGPRGLGSWLAGLVPELSQRHRDRSALNLAHGFDAPNVRRFPIIFDVIHISGDGMNPKAVRVCLVADCHRLVRDDGVVAHHVTASRYPSVTDFQRQLHFDLGRLVGRTRIQGLEAAASLNVYLTVSYGNG
jgi:hypothetical protein